MSELAYRLGAISCRALFQAAADIHILGVEHMPSEGGCLLMGNHVSHFDPMVFAMMFDRQVFYLADLPLLQLPIAGAILRAWDAFPLDRSKPDRAAVRTALRHLDAGRVVGIFPEGGIRQAERSVLFGGPLLPAVISLWQLSGKPVLPGIIIGADALYQWRSWLRRPRIIIKYGRPLPAPRRSDDRGELHDLLASSMRRLYAEVDREFRIRPEEMPRPAQQRWSKENKKVLLF